MRVVFFILTLLPLSLWGQKIELGIDVFLKDKKISQLKGKRVGLITNHTGVNGEMRSTLELLLEADLKIVALFAPEHGIVGQFYAAEHVKDSKGPHGIPVHSLHGATRRPSIKMLTGVDLLIYDIQDIGSRSYTFISTLFYVMEEAAKYHIPLIVLDRPNPINGQVVDGPMVQEKWRSFIGYINIPYCHGLTVGELALLFNQEYHVGCKLEVIPMKGWKREMTFKDTGLNWIPTSPNIPEADTPLFYATTGILGELGIVSIGIGYTLPFKIVGAPWVNADAFAEKMNEQKLPGVTFMPHHFKPFYGSYKGKECQGVLIVITNPHIYRPVSVQYMLLGVLSLLYPKQVQAKLAGLDPSKKEFFCKANGNEEMLSLLSKEKYVAWKLIGFQKDEREAFRQARQRYLLY